MIFANTLFPFRRTNEDDVHDQIGSNSSTPPGAATPRPDLTDKRLPGIIHSYFGQVRDSFRSSPKPSNNSSPAPSVSSTQVREGAAQAKGPGPSCLRPGVLPSPTPSASPVSRYNASSELNGELEKLTEGEYSPLTNQATPPQTPRTRSQESKMPPSGLSQTSFSSSIKSKDTQGATVGPPKGKLSVSISEGRGLRPSVDPYVVCQFQWAEYISEGPRNEGDVRKSLDAPGRSNGFTIRRSDSDMGRPMAIPMRSRQSSNNGTSSDPKENGQMKEVTNPKWEHEAIL